MSFIKFLDADDIIIYKKGFNFDKDCNISYSIKYHEKYDPVHDLYIADAYIPNRARTRYINGILYTNLIYLSNIRPISNILSKL